METKNLGLLPKYHEYHVSSHTSFDLHLVFNIAFLVFPLTRLHLFVCSVSKHNNKNSLSWGYIETHL